MNQQEGEVFKETLENMPNRELMIAQVLYLKDIKDRLDIIINKI